MKYLWNAPIAYPKFLALWCLLNCQFTCARFKDKRSMRSWLKIKGHFVIFFLAAIFLITHCAVIVADIQT